MNLKFIVVFISCASKKEASLISELLLVKKLIACANIVKNIESKYWWNGKIDKACEVMLICKTKIKNFKSIEKIVKKAHSYEVPEIIAIPIVAGSADYLGWISKSVVIS